MTAPPAPAPDEPCPKWITYLSQQAATENWTNGQLYCAIAATALAARDAEIAAERKRADILWQECENLRVAIEDLRLEWRHQFSVRNEYQDMSELERIADAALAAERTQ